MAERALAMALSSAPAKALPNRTYSLAKALARPALALAMATGCAPVGVPWLSPTPEAAPHVAAAVARWTAAGVEPAAVYVGPGGAPVSVVDHLGGGARGRTRMAWDGHIEWVRVLRDAPARTWTHEVGHVLGATVHGGCAMAAPSECAEVTAEDLALAGW